MASKNPPTPGIDEFAVARAAGLDRVLREFREDIVDAARAAARDRDDMPEVDGRTEPWPPMRARSPR